MGWRSPCPLQVFLPRSFQVQIFMPPEMCRLKEGHRVHNSAYLCHTSEVLHLAPSKSLAPILLWRHGEAGLPTWKAQEASSWRRRFLFLFIAGTPIITSDSPTPPPPVCFRRGNIFPAPKLGTRTCPVIRIRPLLSTSSLIFSRLWRACWDGAW